MPGSIVDKVALVTGALSGIGAAIAAKLAAEGAQVIATDITSDSNAIRSQPIEPAWLDVSQQESCKLLVHAIEQRFGRLDILSIRLASVPVFRPWKRRWTCSTGSKPST